jgi:hypothetical protein
MGPFNGPYRYVCAVCWAKPFLYFPGKELGRCKKCWLKPGTACRGKHPRDPSRRKHSRVLVVAAGPLPAEIEKNSVTSPAGRALLRLRQVPVSKA